MRTFCKTDKWGKTAEIWNERITPMRAIWAGLAAVMSLPLNKICPEVGTRNLVSKLKQVVLPAPFGPIKAWIWPRSTFKLTSLTAVNPLIPWSNFLFPRLRLASCLLVIVLASHFYNTQLKIGAQYSITTGFFDNPDWRKQRHLSVYFQAVCIITAAFSAIITVGELVLPEVM